MCFKMDSDSTIKHCFLVVTNPCMSVCIPFLGGSGKPHNKHPLWNSSWIQVGRRFKNPNSSMHGSLGHMDRAATVQPRGSWQVEKACLKQTLVGKGHYIHLSWRQRHLQGAPKVSIRTSPSPLSHLRACMPLPW